MSFARARWLNPVILGLKEDNRILFLGYRLLVTMQKNKSYICTTIKTATRAKE
jgi:hypothetical protein